MRYGDTPGYGWFTTMEKFDGKLIYKLDDEFWGSPTKQETSICDWGLRYQGVSATGGNNNDSKSDHEVQWSRWINVANTYLYVYYMIIHVYIYICIYIYYVYYKIHLFNPNKNAIIIFSCLMFQQRGSVPRNYSAATPHEEYTLSNMPGR